MRLAAATTARPASSPFSWGDCDMTKQVFRCSFVILALVLCASVTQAQFSSSLQGVVEDPSGAVVAGATVTLTNTATNVSQQTTSGNSGDYRFVSVAPGPYVVAAESKGFAPHKINVTLQTDQTMNVRIQLAVSSQLQSVEVTDRAPVLDTAETRTQLTIDTEALDSLPLPGRDLLALTTTAPGVTGLGVAGSGGNGQLNDNYAAETQVSASANGRGSVGNVYVLDGLDITSDITPGVLNLVPNPDTVQEASVQVNTYNVDYGRNSSIVQVMTTRAGTNKYHLMASDYYSADWLHARTEFQPKTIPFAKYHLNNMSFTAGGPIPLLHQAYVFTGWEPLIQQVPGSSQTTYEDPAFTTWAKTAWPNSIGVKLLAQYPATNASTTSVAKTGKDLYPTTCGTASAANIPCSLAVIDNGVFNSSTTRDGLQYNIRGDKYWSKDRFYANYYRTGLDLGGPSIRVGHDSPQHYIVRSIQANETHTFGTNTINEAAFGFLRMEGHINPTGPFHVPIISITGGWGTGLGVSKADEDYVQHHYVWRDAVTRVYRSHSIQVGYQGFQGDNLTFFGPWFSQPAFTFQSIPAFLQDQVFSETGVSYDPLTGKLAGLTGGSLQAHGGTIGIFAQDTWKVNKKLTLTYGLRWDNFGNPAPNKGFVEANFFYGQGSTIEQQVANGYVKQVPHAFNTSPKAWSPRIGAAFDPTGNAKWLIRGGFGLYHDWITLGNVQNEFSNPPAPTTQTFQVNSSTPAPIYSVGTSDSYPFGFTYPTLPAAGLNSAGGIAGSSSSNISGNDPNLHASNTLNYNVTLERALGLNFSLAAGYSGSHSNELFTDFAGHTTNAFYGVDINNFPGSLVQNNGKFVRLNPNFQSIRYTVNGPTSTYNAFIAEFKGRFLGKGSIDLSYTRSSSYDDAGTYPTVQSNSGNYKQYWAPSYWDAPNRLSMAVAYELPHVHGGPDFLHLLTNGWKPSAITILQSGTPFTVLNGNAWKSGEVAGAPLSQTAPGDYNADGLNSDLPNVPAYGYNIPSDRNHQLGRTSVSGGFQTGPGVFTQSDFTAPSALPGEGNEVINGYRNPGYANTDFALLKNTRIRERANLQLRMEVYNLFNRASLSGINGSTNSSSFGRSTGQFNSRFLQLGARVEF